MNTAVNTLKSYCVSATLEMHAICRYIVNVSKIRDKQLVAWRTSIWWGKPLLHISGSFAGSRCRQWYSWTIPSVLVACCWRKIGLRSTSYAPLPPLAGLATRKFSLSDYWNQINGSSTLHFRPCLQNYKIVLPDLWRGNRCDVSGSPLGFQWTWSWTSNNCWLYGLRLSC